ncbi:MULTISPECIES: hypothetical protein [Streptosporangium]|uniref:ABC-type branched-subunit amino acid transport system substrate-binding protein n=1 Tax=Streptosporangium brasiliense TaxID=47480 RepID=A0ABT9RBN7_9ACTN|nr:hypothetical protein [Streptosporangium brasiliense]MDP9866271.1 ABC-type branched-subunit amino acid transport system substrate-binding protein [Streptosporangium brasiliense]
MSEQRGFGGRAPFRKVHPFWFGLLCALLVCALGAGLFVVLRPLPRVTDGSEPYTADLSAVTDLIRRENDWVRAQETPYVSIAVMLPMDPAASPASMQSTDSVRHALQGAYLAQYWSNHNEGDASAPNVQLLLADSSGGADAWQTTVEELKEKAAGQEHLVAVTGLGSSVAGTEGAINDLVTAQIALVGSVITSDRLAGKATMVRVAPSNSAETRAIAHFLKERGAVTAVLVQDKNRSDSYTSTLAGAFTTAFADIVGRAKAANRLLDVPLTYDSSLDSADTVLGQMPERICNSGANVVFFAGRWRNLPPFLRALTRRTCADRKITVVTGDDASNLNRAQPEPLWDDTRANMEVYYTGLAHPAAWDSYPDAVQPAIANRFRRGIDSFGALFPEESLDDGQAIMHHDAMLTAIGVVDIFAAQGKTRPSASAVANLLTSAPFTVAAASGWISFDKQGNPVNKAMPILRLLPEGKVSFTELTSESGDPPGRSEMDGRPGVPGGPGTSG